MKPIYKVQNKIGSRLFRLFFYSRGVIGNEMKSSFWTGVVLALYVY